VAPAGGHTRVSLLIDIQEKIAAGKGKGYERWAGRFNLKEAAKTLMLLKENGIDSYEDLVKKASSSSGDFAHLTRKIKDAEKRMAEISELQKHIGTYGKTRDIYNRCRDSGWDVNFFEEHHANITLHQATRKYFTAQGYGKDNKLPGIKALKQEYATLLVEKKKLYAVYRDAKKNMQALQVAKSNASKILGITTETHTRETSSTPTLSGTHQK